MSRWVVEFLLKRSIEIEASGIEEAREEAFTWVNHEEFREEHRLRDLGFRIVGIRRVEEPRMDVGPRRDG